MEDLQEKLSSALGLRETEQETLLALLRHCGRLSGIPLGTAAAIAMAGPGTVFMPVLGTVPAWFAGFLAGFTGGTAMCLMVHRGMIIPLLKQTIAESTGQPVSDLEAITMFRGVLRQAAVRLS